MELEQSGASVFPKPIRGRISNFVGSAEAADRLRSLAAYRSAKTIFVNPDAAQLAVRELALRDGKLLIIATPKLREGFILLKPSRIKDSREAASIGGAFKHGGRADISGRKVDLIVEGSVAVDRKGGRLGKGGGFGDLEFAILRELRAAHEDTPIVTTVHPIQIVDEVPMSKYDMSIDFIVTLGLIIRAQRVKSKPSGTFWEFLPADALKLMPIIVELRERK